MTLIPAPLPAERTQLTVDQIIGAAMELLEHGGLDRLTIRALAKQLGVAPGAVYYYVASKEDLLHRIAQEIVAAAPAPTGGTWRELLRFRIKSMVETFARFPGSDALAGSAQPWRRAAGGHSPLTDILKIAEVPTERLAQAEFDVTLFMAGALRLAGVWRREGVKAPFAESAELDAAIDTLLIALAARNDLT
jgi:TetR/AcrR family tetracycline transcriptional repressor